MAINYRLAPMHKFPAQIDDCKQAVKWLEENADTYHVDTDRIAAWGYSAGGHLVALLAGVCPSVKAVIAGGAPFDFREITPENPMLSFLVGAPRVGRIPASTTPPRPPILSRNTLRPSSSTTEETTCSSRRFRQFRWHDYCYAAGVTTELVWTDTGHVRGLFQDDVTEQAVTFLKEQLCDEGKEEGEADATGQ